MVATFDALNEELRKRKFFDTSSGYSSEFTQDSERDSEGEFEVETYRAPQNSAFYYISSLSESESHGFQYYFEVVGNWFTSTATFSEPQKDIKKEKAIALIDSWLDEPKNEDQRTVLDRLKADMDESRTIRKLFS
ncbi:hypothetical protein [Thiohalophilus sp.]|uniref:hypothetical protein n=1 Tax=Thiohalophilus sp. TaxID=3028392 RepID=UPI002ACD479F|nr:hypothetical protein [Thiohalophilus sp.]MDZ7805371.1 hypothetical protein [Thiohalophilus sp.]